MIKIPHFCVLEWGGKHKWKERDQFRSICAESQREYEGIPTGVSERLYLWCGKPSDPAAVWIPEQEAKSLISQRSFNPREVFKQREQSFEASSSPAASRPGTQHEADVSICSRVKLFTFLHLFPSSGKLQSPFLSPKGTTQQPRYPPAPAVTLSTVSPPSPLQLYSPATVVTPAAPESALSPVPAAGQNKMVINAWMSLRCCCGHL